MLSLKFNFKLLKTFYIVNFKMSFMILFVYKLSFVYNFL